MIYNFIYYTFSILICLILFKQKVITRAECQTINSGGGTGMVVQQKLSEPITKLPNISEDIEKNERVRDVVGYVSWVIYINFCI